MNSKSILQVNSSGRTQDSITRKASNALIKAFENERLVTSLIERDVSLGLPFIDEQWIGANFTAPAERAPEQKDILANSDLLVDELQQADIVVIGSPIYNFGIPASLKAWIDLIARARLTFQYTENGPQGLLKNKQAYVVIASGGVPVGSEVDFVSPYLKQVLAFIGITDVTIIDANKLDLSTELTLNQITEK